MWLLIFTSMFHGGGGNNLLITPGNFILNFIVTIIL